MSRASFPIWNRLFYSLYMEHFCHRYLLITRFYVRHGEPKMSLSGGSEDGRRSSTRSPEGKFDQGTERFCDNCYSNLSCANN